MGSRPSSRASSRQNSTGGQSLAAALSNGGASSIAGRSRLMGSTTGSLPDPLSPDLALGASQDITADVLVDPSTSDALLADTSLTKQIEDEVVYLRTEKVKDKAGEGPRRLRSKPVKD